MVILFFVIWPVFLWELLLCVSSSGMCIGGADAEECKWLGWRVGIYCCSVADIAISVVRRLRVVFTDQDTGWEGWGLLKNNCYLCNQFSDICNQFSDICNQISDIVLAIFWQLSYIFWHCVNNNFMAVEWGWRVGIYSCCVADIAIFVIRRLCVLTMGAPSNRKPHNLQLPSSQSINTLYYSWTLMKLLEWRKAIQSLRNCHR